MATIQETRSRQRDGMDNDLLSFWLRAGNGLPADEARQLIERLQDARRELADEAEALQAQHAAELEERDIEHAAEVDKARKEGRQEVRDKVVRHVLDNAPARAVLEHIDDVIEGNEPGTGYRRGLQDAKKRVATDVLNLARSGRKSALADIKELAERLMK